MADVTSQNNCMSTVVNVAAAGGYHDVTFSSSGRTPLRWVVFTNTSNANVTIAFQTTSAMGGVYLVPGASTPPLPGPWFGFHGSHDGAGNKTVAVLGQY